MEILTDTAVWMGAGSLLALTGWAVGRWNGLPGAPEAMSEPVGTKAWAALPAAAEPAAIAVPQDGSTRTIEADPRLSLSQLHDEITALRHREQILTTFAPSALAMDCHIVVQAEKSVKDTARKQQKSAAPLPDSLSPQRATSIQRQNAAHPSPGASSFTRV